MSPKPQISLAALAAILALVAPASRADDQLERLQRSCYVMTNKFVGQAIVNYRYTHTDRDGRLKPKVFSDKEIDGLLTDAYGIKKAEMDEKWPGFWSWAASQVRRGFSLGLTFSDMARLGEMECIVRFKD